MRFFTHPTGVRLALLAGILALAGGLAGCNGSSSGNPLGPINGLGPGGNNATVRFVNGSPDAGPVQIFIDNQQQFCTNGTGSSCSVAYGQVTTYAVNLGAGQHAIVLKDQSGNSITIPSGSLSVNGGGRYSIVLTGELHPSYGGGTPNLTLTTFTDQPFNTPSGGAAVNFHYASPYVASTNPSPLQFGYFINNNTSTAASLGQTVSFGAETTPQGITNTAALNVPIAFYAGSPTGPTVTPSQINSTSCSSNAMPCATGNLSLYLIDGPAASTSPNTGSSTISGSATSVFVGTFD